MPRECKPGKKYLIEIDLKWENPGGWPYQEEEMPVHCLLSNDGCGDVAVWQGMTVVIHKFGGSYGPAKYIYTAHEHEGTSKMLLTLINNNGVPMNTYNLGEIVTKTDAA